MITLFFVSMFAVFGMIVWKIFEIKVRKVHFVSNLFKKGDEKIHLWAKTVLAQYKRFKLIANLFVFDFLPSYLYEQLTKMKDYVAKKYYEWGDDFRGRRVLRKTGSVSFFLEQLSEESSSIEGK